MNKLILIMLFGCYSILTVAQVRKIGEREVFKSGDLEMGITTNTGVYSQSYSNNEDVMNFYYHIDEGREFYFGFSAYGGYYLADGLSVGPEIGMNLSLHGTIFIIGNVCYTLNSGSRTAYPYIKAGYGVTDILKSPTQESGLFESLNYHLLNLGIGLKILQSSHMSFTIELNYKHITGSDSDYYYEEPYYRTYDTKVEVFTFSFGSSFVL